MSTCCLCSNLVSNGASRALWNRPLSESSNFVVLPSLGSLVEGWVLVVPKNHFVSMGELSPNLAREMEQVKADVSKALGQRYGALCAFEHGPSAASRNVGCGVDHAHLHIVPLDFDLVRAAVPFMPAAAKWVEATWESCRAAKQKGQDYLYVEQPLGKGRISIHTAFGSQVLRKAIAAHLGVPEQYSWREHPQVDIVAKTVRTLSELSEPAIAV